MSYQTGSATSVQNFLQILSTFIIANGFTVNRQDNDGSYERLNCEKNGYFYNFYGDDNNILLTLSSSYTDVAKGSQLDETPDGVTEVRRCHANDIASGAFSAYHLFYDQDFVHAVIEAQSGVYHHICFGEIAKYGTWTGGAYIDAVYWSTSVSFIDDPNVTSQHSCLAHCYSGAHSIDSMWLKYDRDAANTYIGQTGSSSTTDLVLSGSAIQDASTSLGNMFVFHKSTPTSQTSRVISTPLELYATNGNSGLKEMMGYLPFTRSVNIQLLNSGDIVDTDWIVFPVKAKKDPSLRDDTHNSGHYGYAIKQVI
jgi:hypothetical protein